VYNPYLDSLPHHAVSQVLDVKVYSVDEDLPADDNKSDHVTCRHRGLRVSDQLASESEYEKRVARRRARLLTAAEDSFGRIRRMTSVDQGTCMRHLSLTL